MAEPGRSVVHRTIASLLLLVGSACATSEGPTFGGAYRPPADKVRIYVFTSGSVEGWVSRKILYNREWAGTIRARSDGETRRLDCEYLDLVVDSGRIDIQYLERHYERVTRSQIRRHAERTTSGTGPPTREDYAIGTSFTAEPGSILFVMADLHITRSKGSTESMETVPAAVALPLINDCHLSTDLPEPLAPK